MRTAEPGEAELTEALAQILIGDGIDGLVKLLDRDVVSILEARRALVAWPAA